MTKAQCYTSQLPACLAHCNVDKPVNLAAREKEMCLIPFDSLSTDESSPRVSLFRDQTVNEIKTLKMNHFPWSAQGQLGKIYRDVHQERHRMAVIVSFLKSPSEPLMLQKLDYSVFPYSEI